MKAPGCRLLRALVLLMLASPAAAGPASASARSLTEDDRGGFLLLAVGERFNLSLGSSPSTGYDWHIVGLDGSVLERAGFAFEPSAPVPGAGGRSNWTFEGRKDGETTLRLEYSRSWEKSASPIRTFSVHVVVGAGNVSWNVPFLAAFAAGALLAAEIARRHRERKVPSGLKGRAEGPVRGGGPGFAGRLLHPAVAGAMGLAGIAAMAVGLAGSLALDPHFSLRDSNVSELGVTAGSTFFNWGLIACGTLGVLFSACLGLHAARGRPLRVLGALLLAAAMAALAGIGIFTEAFGLWHFFVAVAFFALYIPASLALGLSLFRDGAFRPAGGSALVSGALGMAAWFLPSGEGIAIPELVAAVPGMVWLGLLAFIMARRRPA